VYLNEVLSQVNQAIVRVGSREELLQMVCRIAHEFGQFRLAWIGMPGENGIRVAAGEGDDFSSSPSTIFCATRSFAASRLSKGTSMVYRQMMFSAFTSTSCTVIRNWPPSLI
jgi:hypothetical protein